MPRIDRDTARIEYNGGNTFHLIGSYQDDAGRTHTVDSERLLDDSGNFPDSISLAEYTEEIKNIDTVAYTDNNNVFHKIQNIDYGLEHRETAVDLRTGEREDKVENLAPGGGTDITIERTHTDGSKEEVTHRITNDEYNIPKIELLSIKETDQNGEIIKDKVAVDGKLVDREQVQNDIDKNNDNVDKIDTELVKTTTNDNLDNKVDYDNTNDRQDTIDHGEDEEQYSINDYEGNEDKQDFIDEFNSDNPEKPDSIDNKSLNNIDQYDQANDVDKNDNDNTDDRQDTIDHGEEEGQDSINDYEGNEDKQDFIDEFNSDNP